MSAALSIAFRPTISSRTIARDGSWEIVDVACRAGPEDRPYEEQHGYVSIAAVVSGSFHYRCEAGRALLYPGALLLGNAGSCFECGHEHGRGDRCIAVHVDRTLFEEVAASAAGTARFRFSAPSLPAMDELLPTLIELEALGETSRRLAAETLVLRLIERVSEAMGEGAKAAVAGRGDGRRVSVALRYLEAHADEAVDLGTLAALTGMSKYHFLRTFRRVTGLTPYKYLLGLRMRRAALKLATTDDPVSAIAFDAGFGDLSTFNNRFKATFGQTPSAFRG